MTKSKITISIEANKTLQSPKNKYDHKAFKTSWTIKNNNPFLTNSFCSVILSQIKPAETPIMIKSNVQTGAKTQFGGLKTGFSKVGYQVAIED